MLRDIGGSLSTPGLDTDGDLLTTPKHHEVASQERQRLIRRVQELETVVEQMRVTEMQGAKNRDMTIGVYQHKVNELMLRAAAKHGFEEELREARQILAVREEARCQLEHDYRVLEQGSEQMESGLSEELKRYEAAVRELEAQLELAEERHKATANSFQLQLASLTEEREHLQQRLFETEEQGRIISAELHLLRRMQSGMDGSGQVAPRLADGRAEGTASSSGTLLSAVTDVPLTLPSPSRCSSAPRSRPGVAGRVPQWFAPWVKSSVMPSADSARLPLRRT
mmetsp:Transcript_99533/g.187123  ORF Transcript_99533/g.187123 Transcript_99533/m.187123 type:complete len:282 (-) Transcript_99533:81-926(-)